MKGVFSTFFLQKQCKYFINSPLSPVGNLSPRESTCSESFFSALKCHKVDVKKRLSLQFALNSGLRSGFDSSQVFDGKVRPCVIRVEAENIDFHISAEREYVFIEWQDGQFSRFKHITGVKKSIS